MKNLWVPFLLFILVCSPVIASAGEYEVVPYTGPERGMYEGGGATGTLSFWELPLSLQIVYISGLLGASLAFYKFLPFLLGIIKSKSKNKNRNNILEFINANPGSSISDIERHLKINRSTIRFHLKILQTFNKIRCVRKGRVVISFKNSSEYTDIEQKIAFFLRNDTSKSILISILHEPGITNQDIAQTFELNKSTVHWHLNELHNEELVHFNSDGKYKKCFINPAIEGDVKRGISES
jgi:predicted transcriptional regulator